MKLAWTTALVAVALGPAAMAESSMEPPMNSFMQAFYTCDGGGDFMMTYPGDRPATAKMRTSNDNKLYVLKRSPVATGVEFDGGGAKFWTDGKTVTVDGTQAAFRNCHMKPG